MRVLILAAVLFLAPSFGRQAQPDFSGTWAAATEAPAGLPAAPSAILGARFGMQQTGDTVTMLRLSRDVTTAAVFKTDGSRTTYRIQRRLCEGDIEYTETLAWEGQALALTAVRAVPPGGASPQSLQTKRLIRFQAPDTLVVEGTLVQGGESRTVGTVYKRTTTPLPPPPAAPAVTRAPATIAQLAWIAGTWSGVNGTTNPLTVEERWTPAASGGMIGVGRTLRAGNALASFEFLCMAERDGGLVYIAMPDARPTPTFFIATTVTADSVTFENPAHDYPKTIRYTRRADGALETTIGGTPTQRTTTFVLNRQ